MYQCCHSIVWHFWSEASVSLCLMIGLVLHWFVQKRIYSEPHLAYVAVWLQHVLEATERKLMVMSLFFEAQLKLEPERTDSSVGECETVCLLKDPPIVLFIVRESSVISW